MVLQEMKELLNTLLVEQVGDSLDIKGKQILLVLDMEILAHKLE